MDLKADPTTTSTKVRVENRCTNDSQKGVFLASVTPSASPRAGAFTEKATSSASRMPGTPNTTNVIRQPSTSVRMPPRNRDNMTPTGIPALHTEMAVAR